MSRNSPVLFVWLAFLATIVGGAEKVIAELKEIDASICFRGGYAGSRDGGATDENVKLYLDSLGVEKVATWIYWLPNALESQVALCRLFYRLGVRIFILNPEVQWNKSVLRDNEAVAKVHVARMRAEFPDCQIGYAPFALAVWHADYPYNGFAGLDFACPQLYDNEFSDESAQVWRDRYDEQHEKTRAKYPDVAAQPWYAMGCLYGHALGAIWHGAPPPGKWTVDDIETWHRSTFNDVQRHLYTIDAGLAEGAPWSALKALRRAEIAERPLVDPCDPANASEVAGLSRDVTDALCGGPETERATTPETPSGKSGEFGLDLGESKARS